jgi:hypothetical protein
MACAARAQRAPAIENPAPTVENMRRDPCTPRLGASPTTASSLLARPQSCPTPQALNSLTLVLHKQHTHYLALLSRFTNHTLSPSFFSLSLSLSF